MSPRGTGPDEQARREAALAAIEAGGIPPAASERLSALASGGSRFFTSDLTTAEFLLVRQAGFRPLTQVMGSCFYSVGWQGAPMLPSGGYGAPAYGFRGAAYAGGGFGGPAYTAAGTYELDVQTEAWNEARRLALDRLAQEARLAHADAVLGVEIKRGSYDWASGLIEFVAVGTAVVSERYDLGAELFLSSLSGQEFASLVRSGYMPVGIVAGSTVAYVVGGFRTVQAISGLRARWQNQELSELTAGLYDARAAVMRRVERQAHELGASGVVATRIEQTQHTREADQQGVKRLDLVVTLHVIGTAITAIETSDEPPPTYVALALNEEHT